MVRVTGVERVRSVIPHRFPVQLVDRVDEVEPGCRIVTRKAVSANEPWCADVADGQPEAGYDLPVALLIESWCQSAALLSAWDQDISDDVALFAGMSGIEVLGRVRPGDVVVHEVVIDKAVAGTWIFSGTSKVGPDVVLSAEQVMTVLRPAATLHGQAAS